ncbi:MAG: abortive infection family protein, partial [Lactobacillaceae bacterium]
NESFSDFSVSSIGKNIMLSEKSKGKSLDFFLENGTEEDILKLTSSLLNYFDFVYASDKKNIYLEENDKKLKYEQVQDIVKKYSTIGPFTNVFNNYKLLNNSYLKQITSEMIKQSNRYPSDAIGKSKDLLEAVIKRILEKNDVQYTKRDNFNKLLNEVMIVLELNPKKNNSKLDPEINDLSSKILGNLSQIINNMNLLRNSYGTGHGKGEKQKGQDPFPPRYAHLVVGSASAATLFLVETYYEKQDKCKL